ncbi:hypothetical protein MRX96_033702 [Rhipicephalus microplus]
MGESGVYSACAPCGGASARSVLLPAVIFRWAFTRGVSLTVRGCVFSLLDRRLPGRGEEHWRGRPAAVRQWSCRC